MPVVPGILYPCSYKKTHTPHGIAFLSTEKRVLNGDKNILIFKKIFVQTYALQTIQPVTAQIKSCSFFSQTSPLQQHQGKHFQRKKMSAINPFNQFHRDKTVRSIAAVQIPPCLTSAALARSPLHSLQKKVFLEMLGKFCYTSKQSTEEGCQQQFSILLPRPLQKLHPLRMACGQSTA